MTGLPEIDGIQPVGVVTKIRGTGQRIDRSLHLGEKILVLVEAEVDEAYKLKQTGDGPKLHQVLQVVDLYELDDEDINVKALLRETRSFYRERDDRRAGRTPLPSDDTRQPEGVAGFVDGSGVVMSAAEIAEARGIDLDPAGDVIVEVAQEAVTNAADVKKRVDQVKKDGKKSVLLLVANGEGELRFVALSVQ
jgi:hypothetical protein